MTKFNVKYTTNTNLMAETLTTKCVKFDTAVSRFCRFLDDYDSCFTESVLIASMNIHPVGYVDGVLAYQAVTETDDYYITLSGCNGIWAVTIEFKHDENTKHHRSISHPEFTESEQTEAEQTEAETTVQKTPSNMRNDINKKFGVNCIYHDTDSIMCDNTIQIVNTHKDYILRAYKNGKEINVPCSRFKKREYAIDYINKLCENGVVSRDVVFTINNRDIYDCFSDVKMTGTTAQIKLATDILNKHYKHLCYDIALEYKMRIFDDIDIEDKVYYANLSAYVTTLKKVLNGNCVKAVIKNRDKFEICGNVYKTAMDFILAYNENKSDCLIRHLENKIRRELFPDIQILF